MANLMVRELAYSEELDRKALMNISGGADCLDLSNCTARGATVVGDYRHIATFDGPTYCVATEIVDNRLKQVWKKQGYQIFSRTLEQEYLCDFCAVGCP